MADDSDVLIELIPTSGSLPELLLGLYQVVYREAQVYEEEFSSEEAQENLSKADLILSMKGRDTDAPFAFAAGEYWDDQPPTDHEDAFRLLRLMMAEGRILYISELGVHPDQQNKGRGKLLLTALLAKAREAGCRAFALITNADNEQALGLYERHNFAYLQGPDGVRLSVNISQRRKNGEVRIDARPYLYLIDQQDSNC